MADRIEAPAPERITPASLLSDLIAYVVFIVPFDIQRRRRERSAR